MQCGIIFGMGKDFVGRQSLQEAANPERVCVNWSFSLWLAHVLHIFAWRMRPVAFPVRYIACTSAAWFKRVLRVDPRPDEEEESVGVIAGIGVGMEGGPSAPPRSASMSAVAHIVVRFHDECQWVQRSLGLARSFGDPETSRTVSMRAGWECVPRVDNGYRIVVVA
ncbi:hypothetical protein BD410DRAFT_799933 [Rickenella mellea]|uniref:Uncharacterized protein n=1 Tax=Rickenella mellea TaxID=50990 RepID=A0A4Y7QHH7_9AGAM|nr:hypothetical protein BD410DRAFT_799933 [Rickenella mellea]